MSKKIIIITLGVLVSLTPFTGFPGGVKTIFLAIAGLVIAVSGYLLSEECRKCSVENMQAQDNKDNENTSIVNNRI